MLLDFGGYDRRLDIILAKSNNHRNLSAYLVKRIYDLNAVFNFFDCEFLALD